MPRAKKQPKKKAVNPYPSIVANLVEIPEGITKSFWPREIKLAKDLCDKFGLDKVKAWIPASKYPSISYLLVAEKDLAAQIERNWRLKNMKIPQVEKVKLEDEPVVESSNIQKTKRTIREWLK